MVSNIQAISYNIEYFHRIVVNCAKKLAISFNSCGRLLFSSYSVCFSNFSEEAFPAAPQITWAEKGEAGEFCDFIFILPTLLTLTDKLRCINGLEEVSRV